MSLSIYPGVHVRVQGEGGPGREHRLPLRHDRQGLQPDEYPLREGTGLSYTAVGFSYSSWFQLLQLVSTTVVGELILQ